MRKYLRYLVTFALLFLLFGAPMRASAEQAELAPMTVTFLDVGEGDCALISVDGQHMLIDGGYSSYSQKIYSVLKARGIKRLNYIVCTHPHEDHVGGLSGALNYAKADMGLCSVASYDNRGFNNFVKYLGSPVVVPAAGTQLPLGGAVLTVLGPLKENEDLNNMSLVLQLDYGATSFLFTGDMEREEEQDLLNAGVLTDVTVLKVGHHGSDSSSSYPFLRAVSPEYAVISVGAGNDYGHPTDNVLSRLRDAGAVVYRTDLNGDITAISNGIGVAFATTKALPAPAAQPEAAAAAQPAAQPENTAQAQPAAATDVIPFGAGEAAVATGAAITRQAPAAESSVETPAPGTAYVLNTNTHKFHYPDCGSVKTMKDKNRQDYVGTREEVINMGYEPCGRCHP